MTAEKLGKYKPESILGDSKIQKSWTKIALRLVSTNDFVTCRRTGDSLYDVQCKNCFVRNWMRSSRHLCKSLRNILCKGVL